MKIILTQHIKGIGKKGEVVEVSDGYAQNSLIPKGLAKVATNTALNKIKQAKTAALNKAEREQENIETTLSLINGKTITIREKLNKKGTLYHALGLKEIIRDVHEQLHLDTPNT